MLASQADLTLRATTKGSEHNHVQKVIRDAYWKHISNIFSFETEHSDPDSGNKLEGDWGEIVALGAEISP